MPGKRPPKKSDPLVVRMPHEDKQAFLDACRKDGRTASDVVRDLIGGYVRRAEAHLRLRDIQPERSLAVILKSRHARLAAAASVFAAVLAALAVTAAPSAADLDLAASFAAMDADGDGVVALAEFAHPGAADASAVAVVRAMRQGIIGIGRIGGARGEAAGVVEYWVPAAPSAWPVPEASAEPGDAEWAEELRRLSFTGFDADGDGAVAYSEFEALHLRMISHTFRLLDADVDGVVSPQEFNAPVLYEFTAPAGIASPAASALSEAAFRRLDHDRDGLIGPAEFLLGPDE